MQGLISGTRRKAGEPHQGANRAVAMRTARRETIYPEPVS